MDADIALFGLGSPLLPGMTLPLHIFEARYRQLVADLLQEASQGRPAQFGVACIRQGHEVGPTAAKAFADVGCLAEVRAVGTLPEGRYYVLSVGGRRFHIDRVVNDRTPYLQAEVTWLAEPVGEDAANLADAARAAFARHVALAQTASDSELPDDPTSLSYMLAAAAALPPWDRQRLLAAPDTATRLTLLLQLLAREEALMRQLGAVPASEFVRLGGSPN